MNAIVLPLARALSTSCRRDTKPGFYLHKFLNREKNVERRMKTSQETRMATAVRLPPEGSRRQKVLNSLYMETITGVLASEFAECLADRNVTIMEVRINGQLTVINAYWTCGEKNTPEGNARVAETAQILNEIAPRIRADLTAVRHMGIIPKINFVQYLGAEKHLEVASILDQLRNAGELDGVELAVVPQDEIPDVFGLDRKKILIEFQTKSAPADINLADRVMFDEGLQESVLKKIRLQRTQKKKSDRMSSSKFRSRWEREIYEQVFCNP